MTIGKTVRLFLTEGTPGSLLTAEIGNWTGHVVALPRSELATFLKRDEATRTGVYILLGDAPDGDGVSAYIGESDDVSSRLKAHAAPEANSGRDFWDRVIVITSKDTNLTKAHVRYLEARLIDLAIRAGRSAVLNKTAPAPTPLPEADRSDMENFIGEIQIVLPVLGVNILRLVSAEPQPGNANAPDTEARTTSPVFEMNIKKHGISAIAQEVDGEFVVREGSLAQPQWTGDPRHTYCPLRAKLERDGVLAPTADGRLAFFTRDYPFSSSSGAAAIVSGRPSNGRTEWRIQGGRTNFGEWQSRGIE